MDLGEVVSLQQKTTMVLTKQKQSTKFISGMLTYHFRLS